MARTSSMPLKTRLAAAALSLLIALPPVPAGTLVMATATVLVLPDEAEARSSSRSSGGYSRPSSSSSSRTPSVTRPSSPSGGSGYSRPSGSASSGGYTRPSAPSSGGWFGGAPSGGGDASISRRNSAESLDRYRAEQQRQRTPPVAPAPAPAPRPSDSYGTGGSYGGSYGGGWGSGWGSGWGWGQRRSGSYQQRGGGYAPGGWYGGWNAPGWAYGGSRSFGVWDGLFLWFLLDNMNRPGYGDWFHHHAGDPGYAQWRAEAERMAQDNRELRAKLDGLDASLRERQGQPVDPNYLPPDTPPDVARAGTASAAQTAPTTGPAGAGNDPGDDGGGGLGGLFWIALLLAAGAVFYLILRRRSAGARTGGSAMASTPLGTAANIIRHKVSGKGYEPSLFRVGMTLTLDPTPFLLAGSATKVAQPGGGGGDTLVSVEAVGRLEAGGTTLHRLYLDGGRGFFQLHLGADGTPDECRWFSLIDEVHPADANEWAFWIDEADGMVGYPQFQTKDGKLYDRQWSPGTARIEPVAFEETLTDHKGSRRRTLSAMLYAAPTGAADPAPAIEYVLTTVVEDSGQALVDIRAGIDINPATLSLS